MKELISTPDLGLEGQGGVADGLQTSQLQERMEQERRKEAEKEVRAGLGGLGH